MSDSRSVQPELNKKIIEQIDQASNQIAKAKAMLEKVIFGQPEVIDNTLISLLSNSHALLIGLPGLAKTRLVTSIGTVLGMDSKRIQCTPDLMPSDILGAEVLHQTAEGERSFKFIKGPVFTQLLMADEINRASPRTQSALLQAMQEYHVTVAGETHKLEKPFHVLATQNPLEQEGTYQLPEAQLDRFMMQIDVNYPDLEAERNILFATTSDEESDVSEVMTTAELMNIQKLVRKMPVGEDVITAILGLVRSLRPGESSENANTGSRQDLIDDYITWGPGPRASQSLMIACRAKALMEKRYAPNLDDIKALAKPILQHRMSLSFAARAEGITLEEIIENRIEQLV